MLVRQVLESVVFDVEGGEDTLLTKLNEIVELIKRLHPQDQPTGFEVPIGALRDQTDQNQNQSDQLDQLDEGGTGMQLQDESMGLTQMFDYGPIMEQSSKTQALFVPKLPITVTAADGSTTVAIGAYEGPNPPEDPVLLDGFNKGLAAGATADQLIALMGTVRAKAAGTTQITIAGGDIPTAVDTLNLTVVAAADAPDELTGDQMIGNLRDQ
jgi:hypothetical protein